MVGPNSTEVTGTMHRHLSLISKLDEFVQCKGGGFDASDQCMLWVAYLVISCDTCAILILNYGFF